MSRSKKRYSNRKFKNGAVRKSKYWVSVVLTFIMMALLGLTFWIFVESFMQYIYTDIFEEDADKVKEVAAAYEEGGYNAASDFGMPFFITDSEGGTVTSYGSITCDMSESGVWYSIISDEEKLYYYADSENRILGMAEQAIKINHLKMMNAIGKIDVNAPLKEQYFDAPLWISIPLKDGGKIIAKAPMRLYLSRIAMALFVIASTAVMFGFIFIVMIVFCINNLVSQSRLSLLFFTNVITGGKNWNWFIVRGTQTIKKAGAKKKNFAYVNLDMTKYSSFCLCHSVSEGEDMLRSVSRRLMNLKKRNELCVLKNSSDFALLLRYDDEAGIRSRIGDILKEADAATGVHKMVFHAGVYLDAAEKNERGKYRSRKKDDFEELFNNAVIAGRTLDDASITAAAYYDDKLADESKWENTVFEEQQSALDNEEFLVYYQPKYDPNTNRLRGAEALIRWQSPKYGFLSPVRFIPIFEKNGFITKIDNYMLEHVARDQKRWLDEGRECVPVSVNVSRVHFAEKDLADQIKDIVEKAGAPRNLIEIELTESAFFDDKKELVNIIRQLKSYGFTVSMDDFGSGYSSLNSLKDMPLDVLKLDADFFRGNGEGDRGKIIVAETIRMARSLSMLTVAEGVEEKEQVDFLAEQHCDMIQGFYFAKPMPGGEYETRMGDAPEGEKESAEESLPEGEKESVEESLPEGGL